MHLFPHNLTLLKSEHILKSISHFVFSLTCGSIVAITDAHWVHNFLPAQACSPSEGKPSASGRTSAKMKGVQEERAESWRVNQSKSAIIKGMVKKSKQVTSFQERELRSALSVQGRSEQGWVHQERGASGAVSGGLEIWPRAPHHLGEPPGEAPGSCGGPGETCVLSTVPCPQPACSLPSEPGPSRPPAPGRTHRAPGPAGPSSWA